MVHATPDKYVSKVLLQVLNSVSFLVFVFLEYGFEYVFCQ